MSPRGNGNTPGSGVETERQLHAVERTIHWAGGILVLAMFILSIVSLGCFVAGVVVGGSAGVRLAVIGGLTMTVCIAFSSVAVMLGLIVAYVSGEHHLTLDSPAPRRQ